MSDRKRKSSEISSFKSSLFAVPERHDIYISGGNEIYFTCNVTNENIERLKKSFNDVIDDNIDELCLANRQCEFETEEENASGEDGTEDEDKDGNESESEDEVKKPFTIRYILNTPGGDLSAAFAFIDFLDTQREKYSNLVFESVITGTVASAGTLMALVAHKRKMTYYATAMIHELSTGYGGNATHFKNFVKEVKDSHNKMLHIYLKESGRCPTNREDVREMEKILNDESWYTSREYLNLGFVDSIIKPENSIPRKKRSRKRKLEEKVQFAVAR